MPSVKCRVRGTSNTMYNLGTRSDGWGQPEYFRSHAIQCLAHVVSGFSVFSLTCARSSVPNVDSSLLAVVRSPCQAPKNRHQIVFDMSNKLSSYSKALNFPRSAAFLSRGLGEEVFALPSLLQQLLLLPISESTESYSSFGGILITTAWKRVGSEGPPDWG